MPEPAHPSDPPLTLEERKRLLVLACEVDRAAWCNSCRPRPRPPVVRVAQLLSYFEPVLALIPGRPGRWLKRLAPLARVARQIGRFVT